MNPWFIQEFDKRSQKEIDAKETAILKGRIPKEDYDRLVAERLTWIAALDLFKELCEKLEQIE
jgi:hypothetical protein